jgi:hypothetical protein
LLNTQKMWRIGAGKSMRSSAADTHDRHSPFTQAR